MIIACCIVQQGLSASRPTVSVSVNQQSANFFGAWRAARFTGLDDLDPLTSQRRSQQPDLGRFPSALAALKGDEFACLTS